MASYWLQQHIPWAAQHPLVVQMSLIAICVTAFFLASYCVAKRWSDPLIRLFRKLDANEAVTSCVLALVLLYAISAEWLGSVAGITGAYLLGYVFAEAELKTYIERTFAAIGHGLLIPLFFVSIGLSSNFRALGGHWMLLGVIFFIAVISKLIGCGTAALVMGMGSVRSFRVGCGMISRGEVGLIVTAMGAATGIFKEPEIAVMVTVVLLTTLFTPVVMRGAFMIKCPQDLNNDQPDENDTSKYSSVVESHAEA
jgi:Kef-type K+ transport system membrane component KefB